MILSANKKPARKNKVLFVNALNQIARDGTFTYLSEQDIKAIFDIYENFKAVEGRSHIAEFDEIESNGCLFSIPLYVKSNPTMIGDPAEFASTWFESSRKIAKSIPQMLKVIGDVENSSKR